MEDRGEIVIYQGDNGKSSIEVRLQEESVWLSQQKMTELFGRDQSAISSHTKYFKRGRLR